MCNCYEKRASTHGDRVSSFLIVYQATVTELYLGLTAPTFKGRQSYNKKNCILETLTLYMCEEKNIV